MGWYSRGGKRLGDLLLALVGSLVFFLPMVWIGFRIFRDLGFPILFRQPRIGKCGKKFLILKFRTLSNGEKPSPFGQWLRKTAMDELPQLFNILKGQMSFVGPRPLIPEELEALEGLPCGTRRLSVRPGLTGLAQIKASKFSPLEERIRWDCGYVERCSLALDLGILLKSLVVTWNGMWES